MSDITLKEENNQLIRDKPKNKESKIMMNIGYSNKDDETLSRWLTSPESPDNDILCDLEDLRGKSRNLFFFVNSFPRGGNTIFCTQTVPPWGHENKGSRNRLTA